MLPLMEQNHLDELLVCRLDKGPAKLEPCTVVIFGASGDLTARKLIPALYHLFVSKQMPEPFRIIGFARHKKSNAEWHDGIRAVLEKYSRTKKVDAADWKAFTERLVYFQGNYDDCNSFRALSELISGTGEDEALRRNLLFYMATPPSQFAGIVEQLHKAGLLVKGGTKPYWQRLVVEKPFGHDLESARQLNEELTRYAQERQIFRIDHYLGKETIQNILMFRFSNTIFERLWNRNTVDHVQITVSEQLGVGSRGGFYEETGALRDVVQNHVLQILSLIGMEPPVSLDAEAIRDEKVKLLKSIRPIQPWFVNESAVRGQYAAGQVDGEVRKAYREEAQVKPDSNVETFVAMRLLIDNWRWSGVPFYLRAGKSLAQSASEVRVQFSAPPAVLFAAQCGPKLDANSLTLRLQPNEGITVHFNGKIPGTSMQIRPVRMHFSYDAEFGAYTPEAYERLLMEAIAGDATLFIRRDEVEIAWSIIDPIRQAWEKEPLSPQELYPAGSWGPDLASELLKKYGRSWRNPIQLAK
jgi:glucose-6-phosphate 1-dehydrogenase